MKSTRGKLLIAAPWLPDPNFAHSIVLIVRHDDEAVVGLVLNRPLELTVTEACQGQVEAAEGLAEVVYQGGPCPGPLMVLHGSDDGSDEGAEVSEGIWFTAQREEIEGVMRRGAKPVKYFANYSGWDAGQLERELSEGSWVLADATAEEVFATDEQQWEKLRMRVTLGIDPKRMPPNPNVN